MPLEHGDLHDWTLEVARLERELEKAERHIADLRELREHDARNLTEARAATWKLMRIIFCCYGDEQRHELVDIQKEHPWLDEWDKHQ